MRSADVGLFLLLSAAGMPDAVQGSPVGLPAAETWSWSDRHGNTRTVAELAEILSEHEKWLRSQGESGERAMLREANLRGANLRDANLRQADLTETDLRGAELHRADLTDAVLSTAYLSNADLRDTVLSSAYLYTADLSGASLISANLHGANLIRANLREANLRDADLTEADLREADLSGANLRHTVYEPSAGPAPEQIAYARNLSWITWRQNALPIKALRDRLKDAGFGLAERQVTAALRRHEASLVETILFDWTCEFGANALRPLWFVGGIWLVCSLGYWLSLHRANSSGLYLLASGKKVNAGNERLRVRQLRYYPPPRSRWPRYILRRAHRELRALRTAALFSLMSTFNIGFRELNFGRWIRMIQPREFDLKAHGWPRVVSGLQSLLSVGLVALSLLSYLGRPFER